jgi:hypothetical protein
VKPRSDPKERAPATHGDLTLDLPVRRGPLRAVTKPRSSTLPFATRPTAPELTAGLALTAAEPRTINPTLAEVWQSRNDWQAG